MFCRPHDYHPVLPGRGYGFETKSLEKVSFSEVDSRGVELELTCEDPVSLKVSRPKELGPSMQWVYREGRCHTMEDSRTSQDRRQRLELKGRDKAGGTFALQPTRQPCDGKQ